MQFVPELPRGDERACLGVNIAAGLIVGCVVVPRAVAADGDSVD